MKFLKPQLKQFFYWINERHRIYEARKRGDPFPWTKDKILQEYKFTNVFRQLDRVTQEWTKRYMHLQSAKKNLKNHDILQHCIMFRLFNWPETYDALYYGGLCSKWNLAKAVSLLTKRQEEDHEQIFTGAYIVPNAGRTEPKIQVICEAIDYAVRNIEKLDEKIRKRGTMQGAVEVLQRHGPGHGIPTVGGFIAYELACDLRHTRVLVDARDVNSWANPGPGAQRGIHRLLTGTYRKVPRVDYQAAMRELLLLATSEGMAEQHVLKAEWPFESREIEHSLCEFDKMMRVKNNEGRPRSRFHPPQERLPWDE